MAGFGVAKWGTFCHSAWLQISPARIEQVYSDKTTSRVLICQLKPFLVWF